VEITEVRIKLMENSDDRLQAFCSITFDDAFVVRDLKIIEGSNGVFVAMPSRKLTSHCHQCGCKNHLRAACCNQCGTRLKDDRGVRDFDGRAKLYADIAHPINSECREMIQNRVIEEYEVELGRAEEPGYVSRYDDEYDETLDDFHKEARTDDSHDEQPAPKFRVAPETKPVQQSDDEPQGPHKPPSTQPTQSTPPKRDGGFGAGVFDD